MKLAYTAPYFIVVLLLIAFTFSLYVATLKKSHRQILIYCIPLLTLILVFVKHPYNANSFVEQGDQLQVEHPEEMIYVMEQITENRAELYCFFSPDCPHCIEAAIYIDAMNQSSNFHKTHFIFKGGANNAKRVMDTHGLKTKYSNLEDSELFGALAGSFYPNIHLVRRDQPSLLWFGDQVNFSTFDQLKTLATNP